MPQADPDLVERLKRRYANEFVQVGHGDLQGICEDVLIAHGYKILNGIIFVHELECDDVNHEEIDDAINYLVTEWDYDYKYVVRSQMKIIIAGSRSITDYNLLKQVMVKSNAFAKVTEIVSGGAKGVDALGERWAKEHKVKLTVMKARWNDLDVPGAVIFVRPGKEEGWYNSKAGIQRNEEMGRYADAAVILWDGVSTGTAHMLNFMKKLGKKVYVHVVTNVNNNKTNDG